MRITGKIMQNNAISNINNNKLLQDKLNLQLASKSKITRPSDDPVVAIRALRLRTNLSEVMQYYEKNIPDADEWMNITEGALINLTKLVENLKSSSVSALSNYKTGKDLLKELETMNKLRDEIYATGDADVAGRNIFTGYRTESRLSFQGHEVKVPRLYEITEQVTKAGLEEFSYVDTDRILDMNETNFDTINTEEKDISSEKMYRMKVGYQNLENKDLVIGLPGGVNHTAAPVSANATPNPYEQIKAATLAGTKMAIVVPETGEVLMSDALATDVQAMGKNEEIRLSYEKSEWKKNDLRPEHYFACTYKKDPTDATKDIVYNPDYLTVGKDPSKQIISYDVGFNQQLRVNTLADECFTHDIGRGVEDLEHEAQKQVALEEQKEMFEGMLASTKYTDAQKAQIKTRLDATQKAIDLQKDKLNQMLDAMNKKSDGYLDRANLALTSLGGRSQRLQMISNRMETQQTSFKELATDNEGIDVTTLTIELSSAVMSYDASLMATGKILQNSLMNFI